MMWIQYSWEQAKEYKLPGVFCLALGSDDSGHDGYTMFEEYISFLAQRTGVAVVTAAGNESNAKNHTQGKLFRTGATDSIVIRVGEKQASFVVNIVCPAYDKISVGIISTAG